jgi:hypothetical protein
MLEGGRSGLSAEGDADIAIRAATLPDGRVAFSVFNFWSYPDLVWGNYLGPLDLPAQIVKEVKLRLAETDTSLKQKASNASQTDREHQSRLSSLLLGCS